LKEIPKLTVASVKNLLFLSKASAKMEKPRKQIAGIENSFVAADNIEYAVQNTIPLCLFGFLY